jgi:RNA polymerase sigma factor (sigma-70 family)
MVEVTQEMVGKYSNLVNIIYSKYFSRWWKLKEDLFQEGYLAICECLRNYNPLQFTMFETYASKRIHGAMVDYISEFGSSGNHVEIESIENTFSDNSENFTIQSLEDDLYLGRIKKYFTEKELNLIQYRFRDNLGWGEICKLMNVSRKTIFRYFYKIKQKLLSIKGVNNEHPNTEYKDIQSSN